MKHDLDYMLQVMQAAKEGKEIQIKDKDLYVWSDTGGCPRWNWEYHDYRIKPEESEPEYIPYETAEEFINDQQKHGKYFAFKYTDIHKREYYLPCNVSSDKNNIGVCGKDYHLTFKTLSEDYIWMDGTPMGKLK